MAVGTDRIGMSGVNCSDAPDLTIVAVLLDVKTCTGMCRLGLLRSRGHGERRNAGGFSLDLF